MSPRIAWTSNVDEATLKDWMELDAPRPVIDGAFQSRPGLFAWDRIDPGTASLIRHVPNTLNGRGADLGAGFGVLARGVLDKAPGIVALDLYEAEKRGLDLALENLAAHRLHIPTETDHRFRSMPITQSDGSRSRLTIDRDHAFRLKAIA